MGMKRKKRASRRRGWLLGSSATQVICISFVLLIALGTLLLTLPISSRSGRLGVVDAMFTATSATCVTGLVVRDTWTQFTPFGQAVVLLLIQVGGLGLVTLTSFFALAAKRRMGFKDLRLLGESVSASGYSQATDVLKIVVKLAMTFEIIGMVLLMIAFVPQFGAEGIWISAFTAISAFCNAGFDLFGRFGQYSSLAPYVSNYYVQAVIMFLIMAGGLGFMVWVEIGEWRKKRHLSLHARMVLLFSCILWVGGVKVTTFAVLILTMRSVAQGRDDCVIGGHHIESKTVYRALTIIMLGMVAALGSAVVVYYNTSDAVTVIDAIFESCSAFGTVGLSVGVTSQLNTGAKLLYMLVMFMGRVGPVSFAISLTSKPDDNKRKILPVGQINVG